MCNTFYTFDTYFCIIRTFIHAFVQLSGKKWTQPCKHFWQKPKYVFDFGCTLELGNGQVNNWTI